MRNELARAEVLRLQRIESFRHDPLGFVEWAFPWGEGVLAGHEGPEAWQRKVLSQIGEGLRAKKGPVRVAVASGHGVGKSALVSWLILWAMATVPGTRGVVTANTETQLKTKTWVELGKWHRLVMSHNWYSLGATALVSALPGSGESGRVDMVPWAANSAEAFAGLHNKGSRLLMVFDEASAIADTIWDTAEGALTDAGTEIVWLVFGNPTRTAGRFHECFGRLRNRWLGHHVDSRSVGLTDKEQLVRWVADYGEESDFVKVRVRGQFPAAGSMQFIGADLVDAAMNRPYDMAADAMGDQHQPLVMGVDVARFGDNSSVIVLRKGRNARAWRIERHRGLDLMTLASRVMERAMGEGVKGIFVDEGGLGAGVVDRLRQLGARFIVGVNFGGGAERWDAAGAKPLYANKRAEIWGNLRDWLVDGCLPPDPELRGDLVGIEYGYNAKSEIQLEKKEDMKKRGLASPDIGDALALTFAAPNTSFAWDLAPPVQEYCVTEYDIYRDFTDEYWEAKDEFDED